MKTQTNPSKTGFQQQKAFQNSSNTGNALYKSLGWKKRFIYVSDETWNSWKAHVSRFKHNIRWHVGGWSEVREERIRGITQEYVLSLLTLEDICQTIALKGSGPVSTALRNRMVSLGLLDTDRL